MPAAAGYAGFFINLERSTSRRARLEAQLAAHELGHLYSRFEAVDGAGLPDPRGSISAGELGCFTSHARLLRSCAALGRPVHVLEDDTLLSPELRPVLESLLGKGVLNEFDLLYTDVFVPIDCNQIADYERVFAAATGRDAVIEGGCIRGMSVVDLRGRIWASTSSYLVSARSIGRFAGLLEDELGRGPGVPIDLFVRRLVNARELKAACVMPFLTSIDLQQDLYSTARGGAAATQQRSRLAAGIVRQLYFVRPDLPTIAAIIEREFPLSPNDARHALISRMVWFRMFGGFESF